VSPGTPDDIAPSSHASAGSRALGWLLDLVTLALFLGAGVAILNIAIALVVLATGIAMGPAATPPGPADILTKVIKDPSRLANDIFGMVLALGSAAALVWGFRAMLAARQRQFGRLAEAGFATFVGKRYVMSREGGALSGVIGTVSILGVAVGVMSLVVVISVMNGFDRALVAKFMGVNSHIEIRPNPPTEEALLTAAQARALIARLESNPDIVGVAPLIQRQTLLQVDSGAGESKIGAMIRGIDPEREPQVTNLINSVLPAVDTPEGAKRPYAHAKPGRREVVLGTVLAQRLGVVPGDKVYAFGRVVTTANSAVPSLISLRVVGVFQTGLYDVDASLAYTNIETAQRLILAKDGEISAVHVRVKDPYAVGEVVNRLVNTLPRGLYLRTWQDLNPEFFKALWIEKVAMFIILMLIVIVASFNIVGMLVMTVAQKTREIGILKSMGATSFAVQYIFLYHGFLIGMLGTLMGVAWGLWICRFVHLHIEKIFRMPGGVYGLDRLPVVVEPSTIGFIVACSMVICVIAAAIPSRRAASLDPVEALRYE
jgi:lipoprotein-releasing system permease protein